jgi:hypothetical protein
MLSTKFSPKKFRTAFSLIELSIGILAFSLLIAIITQSSNLYKKYQLSNATALTKATEVNGIEGIILWLDATAPKVLTNANGSTNIKDGDLIKSWKSQNPQSKNTFDFVQNTGANQPTYKESGINQLPTLFFDSNNSGSTYKRLGTAHNFILAPAQFSVFVVMQPIQNIVTNGYAIDFRASSSGKGFGLYKKNTTYMGVTSNRWSLDTWSGSAWTQTLSSALSLNTPTVVSAIRSNSSNTVYRNGTPSTSSNANYIPNDNTSSSLYIGNIFDGNISEVIMFDRTLSDEDRQIVEKYLGKKYGIKI